MSPKGPTCSLTLLNLWTYVRQQSHKDINKCRYKIIKLFSRGVLSYKTFKINPGERPKVVQLEIGLGNQEIKS